MNNILNAIYALPIGTKFKLNDLTFFEKMTKSEKIAFGKDFSEQVQKGAISFVQFLGKDVCNHANYVRV